MKELILIRHGETDFTANKLYCGINDTPLNAHGILQAGKLCERFQDVRLDAVYSSPLKRAYQTASLVFADKNIRVKKDLREIDFGDFSSLTWDEANSRYPEVYKTWLTEPQNTFIPGGEKMAAFALRVEKCFGEICDENPGKKVAVVTHGGVTRIILLKVMGLTLDRFWTIDQDTTAVNIVRFGKKSVKIKELNSSPWENSYSS